MVPITVSNADMNPSSASVLTILCFTQVCISEFSGFISSSVRKRQSMSSWALRLAFQGFDPALFLAIVWIFTNLRAIWRVSGWISPCQGNTRWWATVRLSHIFTKYSAVSWGLRTSSRVSGFGDSCIPSLFSSEIKWTGVVKDALGGSSRPWDSTFWHLEIVAQWALPYTGTSVLKSEAQLFTGRSGWSSKSPREGLDLGLHRICFTLSMPTNRRR